MSETRRKVLKDGAAALLEGAADAVESTLGACVTPGGRNADHFPHVVVTTHQGRRALFYQDLLLGRTAILSCFSIAHEAHYPVCSNLSKVQDHLGDRLGHDVFIYSLTVDPRNDTPEALAEHAERHGARKGWLFLTGTFEDMDLLRNRLFVHGRGVQKDFQRDCSMGLLRYGNESVGLWGSVPAKADPEWIAKRMGWITPRSDRSEAPRRRGPNPGYPFPGAVVEPT